MNEIHEKPNKVFDVAKEESRDQHNEHFISMNNHLRNEGGNEEASGENMDELHEKSMSENVYLTN